MVVTKIINTTPQDLRIREGNASLSRDVKIVPSTKAFAFNFDPNATYREYWLSVGSQRVTLGSDDLADNAEITVYETPSQKIEWRGSKPRYSIKEDGWLEAFRFSAVRQDSTAFGAVKKDASSKMKAIENSHARLVMLSKRVKICRDQCQNLVQTCLQGVKEMEEAYNEKSEMDMWQLYSSQKLGQLISSLDKLLSTLESIQDLLQACGSNWCSMALVVSLPLPPTERMSSKFDILIKELHWNLETIHYALHLNRALQFKWNDRKFRYVLDGPPEVMLAEDMEHEQSGGRASADRKDLLSQLENKSILVPGNPLLHYLWWWPFATDSWRDKLAAELQKRLKETAGLSNDCSSIPECFWINYTDLKLRGKLPGNSSSKSVWKGEWCGQAVAIGITKNTDREDFEKEARLMLKVQHPNIVGFLGCAFTDDAPPPVRSEEDDKCSAGYLVMELMQEDLRHVIIRHARTHSGNPFNLAVTVDILLQIAGAMVHMHNLDIMHRDLKSANCLVNLRSSSSSSSLVLKLIDFDRSKELDPNAPISNHTVNPGTVRWMAPEVLGIQTLDANSSEVTPEVLGVQVSHSDSSGKQLVPYTRSADVWSFGMTCYEVITGKLPFHEYCLNRDIGKALRDGNRPLIPVSVSCPEGLKALMSRCWEQEPSHRPDFKDIAKELWTIKYQLEIQ